MSCTSQPRSTFPVLEQTLESDADLDCHGLDDELLKANAIRDAIIDEHGDVIVDASLSSTLDVLTDPVAGVLVTVFRGASVQTAAKSYIKAASAAALRMQQLLIYKDERNCPSGMTADPELTDGLVLIRLRQLESQFENEEISQLEYLSARQKLLDDLR